MAEYFDGRFFKFKDYICGTGNTLFIIAHGNNQVKGDYLYILNLDKFFKG